ncbi:HupE/UreJ family protein [Aidingimonas halophila]|uniref:Urease accessory protein n=1 Tax=Aidingimonas halophila TaxID=574349 RepID=A0A1H3CIR0_9GAMM|nr:HupE/UreJ family protein [Aidingimonas halophila]GHC35406.1 protein hupE [Aidingimonas halophila]SDX54027.1 urease accessory protein [Aidingimonas halophila]
MARRMKGRVGVWPVVGSVLLLASGGAIAHPGHEVVAGGFWSGLAHPLLGLDHMVAMMAIGVWSLNQRPACRSVIPWLAAFGMLLGAVVAWGGLLLPGIEFGIVMSVLLMGMLVTTLFKAPTVLGAPMVVLFLFFHGQAHGAEMPAGMAPLMYLAGFIVATLFITYMARWVGQRLMSRDKRLVQLLGILITTGGAFLTLS